jgi:hypothetical protein
VKKRALEVAHLPALTGGFRALTLAFDLRLRLGMRGSSTRRRNKLTARKTEPLAECTILRRVIREVMMSETVLDQHMAVMGRVIAKFVSGGLMPHNIDSRGVETFLGVPEDKKVFEGVIVWMLDEGIIRA